MPNPYPEDNLAQAATPAEVAQHPLIGRWSHDFKPEDAVEISIGTAASGFDVRVSDKTTKERATVYDVVWNGEMLSYNMYWKSTGRYLRCRIQFIRPGHITYTYMSTTTEMWSLETAT